MGMPVLISACLLGAPVRYDGGSKRCLHPVIERWAAEGRLRSLCPEMAGGLPTPRPPAEIKGGVSGARVLALQAWVVDAAGRDLSTAFIAGAEAALALVREHGIRVAVLKEGSPSCGSEWIADGSFSGRRVTGDGVTAAALRAAGVHVFSEDQLDEAATCLSRLEHSLISPDRP